jgi:AcrR family transcriptional regulator
MKGEAIPSMDTQVAEAVRPRDREATRQRLLAAARALFSEHGYEHVTVRMIAAEAEANVALVGRYFGSKAGLFSEVLQGEPTIRRILDGDAEGLARRLAVYAANRMAHDPKSRILRSLDHSSQVPRSKLWYANACGRPSSSRSRRSWATSPTPAPVPGWSRCSSSASAVCAVRSAPNRPPPRTSIA